MADAKGRCESPSSPVGKDSQHRIVPSFTCEGPCWSSPQRRGPQEGSEVGVGRGEEPRSAAPHACSADIPRPAVVGGRDADRRLSPAVAAENFGRHLSLQFTDLYAHPFDYKRKAL